MKTVTKSDKPAFRPRLAPMMPYILIVGGIIGSICSFIITYDKLKLTQNPHFVPSCDLNPVISCGSVMSSAQGSAFGFPNSWIGLSAFAVLITIGVAMLAGATFRRWFWLGLEAGIFAGMIFAYWLLFVSIFVIHALCPYCLTVDVVLTAVFWYLTLYVIREHYLPIPRRLIGITDFCRRFHFEILLTWFLLITALIIQHFWYYYGKFL